MNTATVAIAILLPCIAIGCGESFTTPILSDDRQASDDAKDAVRNYIRGGDLDLSPDERAYILEADSIEEVEGWPFQERLKDHRLFATQMGWNRQAYIIVTVSSQSKAWHISNEADFNEILRDEGVLIESEEEAQEVAQLYLKCQRVSAVMYQKWDLGMYVVSSLDDIDFRSEAERDEVGQSIDLSPPQLTKQGEQYEYVLYSWDIYGAGKLWRHTVVINGAGIVSYQVDLVKPNVGT